MNQLRARKLTAFLLAMLLMVPAQGVWAGELFEDAGEPLTEESMASLEEAAQSTEQTELFSEGQEETVSFQEDGTQLESDLPEEGTWIAIGYENPLYGGQGEIYYGETDAPAAFFSRAAEPRMASINEAVSYFRSCMVNREESISFQITADKSQVASIANEIFQQAIADTGNLSPVEGDYLKFQYGYMGCKYTYSGSTITYRYQMLYYTTYEQEVQVTKGVREALASLNLAGKSNDEKIKSIYDYVCGHVSYDRNTYERISASDVLNGVKTYEEYLAEKGRYTAYHALVNGSAVCQGYSNLLYRMLKESGIDNRIISGIGNGVAHAWNIIRWDDFYYNVDSTWDAGRTPYSYYKTNMEEFTGHTRDAAYLTDEFMSRYPVPQRFPKEKIVLNETVYIYTGEEILPSYSASGLTEGVDYQVTYENNVDPGIMTMTFQGIGRFYGESYTLTAEIRKLPDISTVTGVKQTSQSTDKVLISWNPVPGATNYQVYLYSQTAKKYYCKATVSTPSYLLQGTGVNPGREYTIRVRAYFRETYTYGGSSKVLTSLGNFSTPVTVVTRPQAVTISSLTTSSKRIAVRWGRFSGCTGYQIQYSTSPNFTAGTTQLLVMPKNTYYGKVLTTLGGKALKSNTRYYVRMRAYKQSPTTKTNYYGSWGTIKNLVCK